ncbi:12930_t:CDS:2, partial [Funneliformis geosporum]
WNNNEFLKALLKDVHFQVFTIRIDESWKNIRVYKKYCGTQLFGLEHPMIQKAINNKEIEKNNVKEELEKRSFHYDEKEIWPNLIAILNENIANETINKIAEVSISINMNSTVENNNVSDMRTKKGKGKKWKTRLNIGFYRNNYFRSDWALRENQEYEKKGDGKHIPERVLELLKVEIDELEENDIPKLKTIENWISRYSYQYKQAMAEKIQSSDK